MSGYSEPRLIAGASIIDDTIIRDLEIFQKIGYRNYIQLHRKYPFYFKYFAECDNLNDGIGYVPASILLFVSDDPKTIKCDIVKTIYYNIWFSPNSDLVFESKDIIQCRPTEFENTVSIWIFICIVIVSLIVLAIYILIKSPHTSKLLNISKFEFNNPY